VHATNMVPEILVKWTKLYSNGEIIKESSEAVADVAFIIRNTLFKKLIYQDSPLEEESRNSQTMQKKD
jgi:hypothetical protein